MFGCQYGFCRSEVSCYGDIQVRGGIWDHILSKAKNLYHSLNPWSWHCESVSTCSWWPERKSGPEGPQQEGDFTPLVSRAAFPNSWAIWINWITTKKCLMNIFKSLPKQIWNCCHSNNGLGWLSLYESFKYRFRRIKISENLVTETQNPKYVKLLFY